MGGPELASKLIVMAIAEESTLVSGQEEAGIIECNEQLEIAPEEEKSGNYTQDQSIP